MENSGKKFRNFNLSNIFFFRSLRQNLISVWSKFNWISDEIAEMLRVTLIYISI